jgi:SAM-dependent methyltransferase
MSSGAPIQEAPNEAAASADFELEALTRAINYRTALVAEFAPHLRGSVLEVGAGAGHVTAHLRELPGIESLRSVEPAPHLAALFRRRLPGQSLVEGTIDDDPSPDPLDAIVTINVLEHIRDDDAELRKYAHRLRPRRGSLCLFVPARQEIYAPIDRDFGHHRRYERRALRSQLERAGFTVERLDYFNCVGYLAWWLNFRVRGQRHFDPGAVTLFDRVIFPVVNGLERRFGRPPIGQSLLAIARA